MLDFEILTIEFLLALKLAFTFKMESQENEDFNL